MKRHVALIVETSSAYGRDLLSGIVRFMRMHDQWSVFLEQRDLWKQPPSWLNSWQGDGIISRATTPKLLDALQRTAVPLVELTDRRADVTDPGHASHLLQVRSDDAAIGRMGAEHLLDRGFRHFGFCGFRGETWSTRREEAFAELVEARTGVPCSRLNTLWHGPAAQGWDSEQQSLVAWLEQMEPPFAIMACNDIRGQHVVEACSRLALAVPEQVAVMGVDNDELLCRVCAPPLSSVVPNAELVGFRAAEALNELMNGRAVEERLQRIPPLNVQTRQSTDVVAIEDRDIAAALHYIRDHACHGLTVRQVLENNPVSRSTLERQMRKYLGRTPQEEIRNVQVKRAKELLLTTELSAERIATLCGFEHTEYFYVVFKRVTGMTTKEFRQRQIG